MTAIASPCIRVCIIEPATGLCRGCARTLDEIAGWAAMGEARRQAVMAALPDRLEDGAAAAAFPARGAARQAAGREGAR